MKHKNFNLFMKNFICIQEKTSSLKKKYYSLCKLIMCNSGYVSNKLI